MGIKESMADIKENETLEAVKSAINAGREPTEILEELREGITEIGDKFERAEYFLTDLIMGSEIFKGAMEILKPKLEERMITGKKLGSLVIGTVQGDVHDIGKNIFSSLMEAAGFEVYDLGVNVSPDKFIEAIRQYNPNLVGMSALMSGGLTVMDSTIKAIENAGLREKVGILIGGGIAGEALTKEMLSADGFTEYASVGVKLAKKITGVEL